MIITDTPFTTIFRMMFTLTGGRVPEHKDNTLNLSLNCQDYINKESFDTKSIKNEFIEILKTIASPDSSKTFEIIQNNVKKIRNFYKENIKLNVEDQFPTLGNIIAKFIYEHIVIRTSFFKTLKECLNNERTLDKSKISTKIERLTPYFDILLRESDTLSLLAYYYLDFYNVVEVSQVAAIKQYLDKKQDCFKYLTNAINNKKPSKTEISEGTKTTSPLLNYDILLGEAGKVYSSLSENNYEVGLIASKNRFSNELVFEIASTILENTDFYFCEGLTVHQLSHDITNTILNHIHDSYFKYEGTKKISIRRFLELSVSRYMGGRSIRNYYYYLKMCSKIYGSAEEYIKCQIETAGNSIEVSEIMYSEDNYCWDNSFSKIHLSLKMCERAKNMESVYYPKVLEDIIRLTKRSEYHFLYNLSDYRIARDILMTHFCRDNKEIENKND